jgi:hypothetical protein
MEAEPEEILSFIESNKHLMGKEAGASPAKR